MRGKRLFDLVLLVASLPLTVPLLLATALVVRVGLGSPVFFVQERTGLGGRSFRMVKFRSMTDARGMNGKLLPDAQRLTALGRALRASSLDELPELINVARGEMSLVGPRPLLPEYLPLYSPQQARRHDVLPGITGWAQVNGRNALSWEEKFAADVWYVEHRNWRLDGQIILRTIANVLTRRDIAARGEATMARFEGSQSARASNSKDGQ